jgi:GH15 family glucan-1,4-alpha-glucosidase
LICGQTVLIGGHGEQDGGMPDDRPPDRAPCIGDLALISDLETAALVDRTGAIVWACLPRFDVGACFASILGTQENGFWRIAPADPHATVERRYRTGLVLESTWTTSTGLVQVLDFMPPRDQVPDLVRLATGVEGEVEMRIELVIRTDYGSIVPWVRRVHNDLVAIAGPDRLRLHSTVEAHGEDLHTVGEFTVRAGERFPFVLDWQESHAELPPVIDADNALARTQTFWDEWTARSAYDGAYADDVHASLAVLKGLTYHPTGAIVAAPTTSLPEQIGGIRNWDYRFCWLRDATFTLLAFLESGHVEEAIGFRNWLLRAVAGNPETIQIMYGIAGERRLPELELRWLDGHRGSAPVRVGNAAHDQFQLDVWGELMDVFHQARVHGIDVDGDSWNLQRLLMEVLAARWQEPDEGIWEVRGPRRHFTHSKVMAWVAADRAVKAVEEFDLEGPIDDWKALRAAIRDEVLTKGVDDRGVFTQHYGTDALDASLLLVPLVGFLPPDDERVIATTEAIAEELTEDGYVLRYRTPGSSEEPGVDGLQGREGAFLLCTFWLAQNWALQGQIDRATELFERLLALRNDVGLLSEQVDPRTGELLGNMPQAFSHLAIVNTAMLLCEYTEDGVRQRAETTE